MGRRQQGRGDTKLNAGRRGAAATAVTARLSSADGHWAEVLAAEHLERAGWRVLATNYRLRGGELDIVCEDQTGTVVIVEVKQRRSAAFGGAAAAIGARKLARLRLTAAHYLAYQLKRPEAKVRFDALLVTGDRLRHSIEHLEDIA